MKFLRTQANTASVWTTPWRPWKWAPWKRSSYGRTSRSHDTCWKTTRLMVSALFHVDQALATEIICMLRAWHNEFIVENRKMCFDFLSFFNTWMKQVVEILLCLWQGPTFLSLSLSVPWLLMVWRRKEPSHQQPWYWCTWTAGCAAPWKVLEF